MFPVLKSRWMEEGCDILFDGEDLCQTKAKIAFKETTEECSIHWNFPILSKKKIKECLSKPSNASIFQVQVEKVEHVFKVTISSRDFQEEAECYRRKIDAENFTGDEWRVSFHADWCTKGEDKDERQKFLKYISELGLNNSNAAVNANAILNASHHKLI